MSIFNWNPIKKNVNEATNSEEFSTSPITFVPKNYVRQRKHRLYNNLLILLGGLWALTISHDMDIFDIDTRVKLKNILAAGGLLISHLLTVPFLIRKLRLHYSIVIGAMGMSIVPFLYHIDDPILLSILIFLRMIFSGLFDVSATIYIVKLATLCSRIQGNAMFNELLTMRAFIAIFSCSASIVSSAWRRYTQEESPMNPQRTCGPDFRQNESSRKMQISEALSIGQNTIFIAVAIVITFSGIILIAMYLKPITGLGDADLSGEPRPSGPFRIIKQIVEPKAKNLAILIASCVFMYDMTDEFLVAYVTCSFSMKYSFLIECTKQLSTMFGVMTCLTIVDLTGFRWLYGIAQCGQLSIYLTLLMWEPNFFKNELSYMIAYDILCTSISVEITMLQIFVIETLGDDEVSAWCSYYVVGDAVYLIRTITDYYLCTGVKLWILIAISPLAMLATATYCQKNDEKSTGQNLHERCTLLLKTTKRTLEKSASYDLKIVVEEAKSIRKVETFLRRKYVLQSRYLVPPVDEALSEIL